MNGQICDIIWNRGFFFIRGEDGKQYFGHRSGLVVSRWIYDIQVDDAVEFVPDYTPDKGPRAEKIIVTRLSI